MLLRSILLISIVLAILCPAAQASDRQPAALPDDLPAWIHLELEPAEADLLDDAADGRLDGHDLLAAALVADGVRDPAMQNRYRQQFDGWLAELLPALTGKPGAAARAEVVFGFLQRRVLRGSYRESCSSLPELFEHGNYNCVSSTIVFCCLGEHSQLEIHAAEAPGHVIARLTDRGKCIDIETTCRDWRHGASLDAATASETYRQVSPLGLLALAYYNRGVDAQETGDFERALAENIKALRFDPASRTARSNLLAALNNGALAASGRGHHRAALERLHFARRIDPEFEPATKNLEIIRRRQVIELCNRHEFRPALALLAEARRENSPDAGLQAFEVAVINREGLRLLDANRTEEAVDWYRQAVSMHPATELLGENLRVAVMRWADEAFRRHDYANAISRTEYASHPGELDAARLNNLRYGYQQWIRRLRAAGRDAEASQVARQAADDPFLATPAAAAVQSASADPGDLTPARG